MKLNSKKLTLALLGLFLASFLHAQDYKLDDVSEKELSLKIYEKDSTASAVYLNKVRETYLDYNSKGWIFINEVTERIKILNKDGLEYATKKISSYKDGSEKERVDDIKAITYTLSEGKVIETKLAKDAIFDTERSEHWDLTTFTMPDVKVGSVVEWSYKTISPFYKIDDLIIQEDIPVVHYYAKIKTPGMFQFRRLKKGSFEIKFEESVAKAGINFENKYSQTTYVNYNELVAEYTQTDVPALKEEIYVTNPENYRRSVIYELISTEFNKGNKKEYSTTWGKVAETIFKNDEFGGQFKKAGFLKNTAELIVAQNPTLEEQINASLKFVKSKITWNGNYGKYVDEGIVKAYKNGSGNVSEINILLTALLRACGIEANPILIGTKRYGTPLFPTLEGYNYVIAGVRENGKTILLDATDKLSAPNILPIRAYNWFGTMINKDGAFQKIDLYETIKPMTNTYIKATISEDGPIEGELKQRYTSLEAFDLRQKVQAVELEKWQELQQDRFGLEDFSNYTLENLDDLEKPIVESFNFAIEQGFDRIGDQLILTPLLFLRLSESPFKSDERQFPIDFDYPYSRDLTINFEIPVGYSIKSLPKSINVALPGEAGSFLYSINQVGNMIQVLNRFAIKDNSIPVEYYGALKEFYKMRVEKENEKIILQKTL